MMDHYDPQSSKTGLEIAVIGMAGRFPGANNIREFWENIKNGVESITFFSDAELASAGIGEKILEKQEYIKAKGILDGVEYFDPSFFNFTPKEAAIMDPQLRIFLECCWHALEDAGYDPGTYEGGIGVFSGNSLNHYWIAKTMFNETFYLFGQFKADLLNSHFSTQVSYHLNLKGPSLTIQTACSTSLVTIHTACMALLSSECDMALAGGASLSLPQTSGYFYQEGMVGSPDGHCRAFDARAAGTVSGSGAAAVLLKPLENALEDGDHIYAIVKGTAINNDGLRKVGYTAPSIEGQAEAIKAAYIMAEVEPGSIGYIETHGTGTDLGDPVEIEALTLVFKDAPKHSIPIGSVKTNVGHLDTAAGVTGFIKTVLMLKQCMLPPSLHFSTPNPKIDFEKIPFYVNTGLTPWQNNGQARRAAVSSFGLGGTNAHAVLEEAPETTLEENREVTAFNRPQLIFLSARSKNALEELTGKFTAYLAENPDTDLADIAYTLYLGRKHFQFRRMALCSSIDQAVDMLSKKSKQKGVKTFYAPIQNPPVVFLLSGQGAQYEEMGRDLYERIPVFRREMDHCLEILKSLSGIDLKGVLYPSYPSYTSAPSTVSSVTANSNSSESVDSSTPSLAARQEIDQTEITQPLVFIFEYALARLLMHYGIKPKAMIGYSMGEYIAACLAGVFSLEEALQIVTVRGKLMQKTPKAVMLSVPLPHEQVEALLEDNREVFLAIDNGPSCIVTGTVEAVKEFEHLMREKRLVCAPINMLHAVHSVMMEPIRREFTEKLAEVSLNSPHIPYISNVSGQWITTEQALDPEYWGKHLCTMVKFSAGITELLKKENAAFIEIGPGRILSNILRHHIQEAEKSKHQVVNIIKHQQENIPDDLFLLQRIGELWLYGVGIDWKEVYREEKRHRVPLPLYPFQRKRYWIDQDPLKELAEMINKAEGKATPLKSRENPLSTTSTPGLELEATEESVSEEYDWEEEGEEYVAPRDELEQAIAEVWQSFLGFERIGIYDNFFDINGDSLIATQLVSRLQQVYPVEITLQRFFEDPTIAHQADVVRELLIEKVKGLSEEELEELVNQ